MWKLPMFGCKDSGQVLAEIENCKKTFPGYYIRLAAFDAVRQVTSLFNDERAVMTPSMFVGANRWILGVQT